jgi:hypothetical protein
LLKKKLATSGKSPAYVHRRKNSARAGKPVAGFLIRTAIRINGRIHPASALPQDAFPGSPSEPVDRHTLRDDLMT